MAVSVERIKGMLITIQVSTVLEKMAELGEDNPGSGFEEFEDENYSLLASLEKQMRR
ncbi:hypothetical protein NPIL_623221, partial [Nephila pilipes]